MAQLDRAPPGETESAPARAGVVLISLILVAAVANLNLAVANVALPDIDRAFDAGQTELNLVTVGYSLGLTASVLYLGALGDRYGRKLMLILGTALAIPASLVAALAPSIEVLFLARLVGGLAAGMAFPTTLALITALWSGPARTRSIALWSALGGAISALGPLLSGALLTEFDWGSVFLVTLPLAVVALYIALRYVPAHVNEATDPVDNLGGILSVLLVAALVLSINFAPVPNEGAVALGLAAIALAAAVAFVVRQRRAKAPLYDLDVARRRIFWVAACAGIVVFGTLMGAMFVGQQFLQNVLGYSTLDAGVAILPAAALMVVVAPRSAKLVSARGTLGAVLTAGYAAAIGAAIAGAPNRDKVTDQVQAELTKSFSSAVDTAQQHPLYESQIVAAAKSSFLQGDEWAYIAGIVAILLGAALIFFLFPKKDREAELLAQYHSEDVSGTGEPATPPASAARALR